MECLGRSSADLRLKPTARDDVHDPLMVTAVEGKLYAFDFSSPILVVMCSSPRGPTNPEWALFRLTHRRSWQLLAVSIKAR
jgi:hypothetical protein